MRRAGKLAVASLLLLALLLTQLVVPLWTYLPHARVVLRAPFPLDDPPGEIVPMGETAHHPKPANPRGHPGIDFVWDHAVEVLAAADGRVASASRGSRGWDVEIRHGVYATRYAHVEEVPDAIRVGARVRAGDVVGVPVLAGTERGDPHRSFHWELASINVLLDRFCPLGYFEPASRDVVERAWRNSTYADRDRFPDLCSGDYANREG